MIVTAKSKQVYEVMLMPIKCVEHCGFGNARKVNICRDNNSIKSTETYWSQYRDRDTGKPFRYPFVSDCDMSDFACGFYEILYKDILQGMLKLVDEDGNLVDKEFAGDTMTSVSKLPGLRDKYHCLANFWLLPMEIGRTSKNDWTKTSRKYDVQDFMDRFLLLLKGNFEKYKHFYPSYFKEIDSFENFVEIHYLGGSYIDKNFNINEFSNIIDTFTSDMLFEFMKNRAESISKSEYVDELWDYFNKWGL